VHLQPSVAAVMTKLSTEQGKANGDLNSGAFEFTMQSMMQDPLRSEDVSFAGEHFMPPALPCVTTAMPYLMHDLGEGRAHKRLHKQPPNTPLPSRPSEPTPLAGVRSDSSRIVASRRRQSSMRDSQAPNVIQGSPSQRYVNNTRRVNRQLVASLLIFPARQLTTSRARRRTYRGSLPPTHPQMLTTDSVQATTLLG